MKLYSFDTVLKFGQHKGETVAEALKNNPTYLEWCYGNIEEFYITDAVWEAFNVHKDLEDTLKSGGIDPNEVRRAIDHNQKLHQKKRNNYKSHMMGIYEQKMELKLKGNYINEEDLPL